MYRTEAIVFFCVALTAVAALSGCAMAPKKEDPYENFNRQVYKLNKTVDTAIVKPIAVTYQTITPEFVDKGVTNFFGNIGELSNTLLNALQADFDGAVNSATRLAVNTTVGVAGIFDVASNMGIERDVEDVGQTLGKWGLAEGNYVVLPLLGPSTMRDTAGLVGDFFLDPVKMPALQALRAIDMRADFNNMEKVVESVAIDEYEFVREAYLQRRRFKLFDGVPPADAWDELEEEMQSD
ncbi:MAG: VacJ family lipoprotein [Pseudomonadota bacterium]